MEKLSLEMSNLAIVGSPSVSSESSEDDVFEDGRHGFDNVGEINPGLGASETELVGDTAQCTVPVEVDLPIQRDKKFMDNSEESVPDKSIDSVKNAESEINFIPELVELTQYMGTPNKSKKEEELAQSVEKFKKASEHYKKKAGIAVTRKKMNMKEVDEHTNVLDNAAVKEETSSNRLHNRSHNSTAESLKTKSALKRKSELKNEDPVKAPILHTLLVNSALDKCLPDEAVTNSPTGKNSHNSHKESEAGGLQNHAVAGAQISADDSAGSTATPPSSRNRDKSLLLALIAPDLHVKVNAGTCNSSK